MEETKEIKLNLTGTKEEPIDNQLENYMTSVNYSELTKYQYRLKCKRLIKKLLELRMKRVFNQETINAYLYMLQGNRNPNNIGFIKAYMKAYDPRNKLDLIIPETKGRRAIEENKVIHKFLDKEQVDYLINNIKDPQLRLMIKLYTETGLRATELLLWDANDIRCRIDWDKRIIKGVGKYAKLFSQPFSQKTCDWLRKWILLVEKNGFDRKKPFIFYKTFGKRAGQPYKNQHYALWNKLNKACKAINFPEHIHPHRFRHFVGHFLRINAGMDLEQIRKYLRHKNLETTRIYSSATDEELYEKMNKEVFR